MRAALCSFLQTRHSLLVPDKFGPKLAFVVNRKTANMTGASYDLSDYERLRAVNIKKNNVCLREVSVLGSEDFHIVQHSNYHSCRL